MAHSEAHYRAAAQGLGEGFLGSAFDRSSLPDSDVSRIHTIAAFREEAELMGLKGGSVAGVQERGMRLARNIQDAKSAESEKARRSADNVLFLNLLDEAGRYAAQLAADVAEIESGYEAQYGDAWVEQIALEVLGPDEIPEREDGEDIVSYRERVKDTLLAEMIDPTTGKVRPEHAESPHANWAERRWKHEQVDAQMAVATDESRPQAERDAAVQAVIDTGRADDAAYAITSFEAGNREYEMLGEAISDLQENTSAEVTNQSDLDAFFAP